jgi:surface protein
MNKKKFYYLLVPLVFLLMSTFSPLQAITFYSASSGPWNSSATWGTSCGVGSGAGIPTAGDDVIICNGYNVSISGTNVCRSINISNGGTLSATTSGNVLTCGSIGTVTIDLGGTFSENQSTGANTFNFQGTFINNGTFTSNTSVSNTSTYNFHGNITNTGVFQLINNGFYDFESTLSITPTADMMMGYSGGGGTIRAFENTTINNGAGHITFNGDLDIATGKVFTNNNTTARLKFALNGALTGAGTYVNGTDSYLEYVSNSLPMSGGTFDVDATGNTVDYNRSGDQNNVRATVYFNLTFSGTGNKVLLNTTDVYGNVLIDGSATLVAGSNLLTIVGNFTKTGSATFNAGTGFVMFTAGTPTISGVTNFYGITLTGSSPTVTLSNSITVSYGLYLVNGKIDLDAYDITFTGPTNQLTSGGGWLATTGAGKLIRSLSGSNLLFPVGSATQYQPINIATSATNASVRFGSPTMTVPNSGVGSWYVDNGSTTSDITLISPQGGILTWGDGGSQITRYSNHQVQPMTYPFNDEYTTNILFVGFEEEIGIFTCGVYLDGAGLADGTEGVSYTEYRAISTGTSPYTLNVIGSLPSGISANISLNDVVISGTPDPASSGSYSFDLQVTDANGCTTTQSYGINVNAPPPPTPLVNLAPVSGTTIAENILQANRQRLYSIEVGVSAAATDLVTLTFNTTGTYSISDITGFKLYTNSSESTDDFASASEIASHAPVASGGTITFSTYQNFSPGTNYLYIAVDVSPNSVLGRTIAIPFIGVANNHFFPEASVGASLGSSGTKTFTTTGFVTTWQASGGSITIPTTGGGYNYEATCTNITTGTIGNASVSAQTGNVTFSGLTDGDMYQVVITGTFPRIFFNNGAEGQDISKIRTIQQWGDITWASMGNSFWGCANLTYNATDIPILSPGNDMQSMFRGCSVFNGDISSWDVSNVTDMNSMFDGAILFNQDLSLWDVSNVTSTYQMFTNATNFNQPIGSWNTGVVNNMSYMFKNCTAFNSNISTWNTSSVQYMSEMFNGATAFNQNIGSWNTSAVVDMPGMFFNATAFNQNIGSWNVSNVTNMSEMFRNASAFNQSLGTWQLNTLGVNMSSMLDGCGMNTANYDATLIGWADQVVQTGQTLGATGLTYCTSFGARNILTSAPNNWTITDGGPSGSCPAFSAVTATDVTTTSFTANWTAGTPPYTLEVANDIGFTSYVAGYSGLNVGNVVTM